MNETKSPAAETPKFVPSTFVLNVAQRDPYFRKWMIEQLTAMGDKQDKGPLVSLPDDGPLTAAQERLTRNTPVMDAATAWAKAWGAVWDNADDDNARDALNDACKFLYDALCVYDYGKDTKK